MCTICMITGTFDPLRHPGGPDNNLDTSSLTTSEMSGAVSVSVGSSTSGVISFTGEQDFYSVTFEAGKTYVIDGLGNASGGGFLSETDLHLYDSAGNYLDYDDLSGEGLDAQITFTATSTSTYFIMVDGYLSSQTGSYKLEINEAPPPPPPPGSVGTVEQMAEFLQSGYQGGTEYTFDTSASNVITVNLDGLTAEGKQLARWAMDAWEMVVDLDFQEVAFGEMLTVDDNNSGAYAYFPGNSSWDGVEINVGTGWLDTYGTTLDSYSFQTYIHEFGHALGLGHQGSYNGFATYGIDEYFTNDSWQMSIMSYFSQTDNTTTDASYALLGTTMMVDIYAIQDFYGAPGSSSATAGNTTYGLGSNLGNYMDEIFAGIASGTTSDNYDGNVMAFTIYDHSGKDTVNVSFLGATQAANINLNDGTFSDFGDLIGIMGIALGTVLENVVSGAGNDTITGNEAYNVLSAGKGNDIVYSGSGNDTTNGGIGNDTLYGGAGNDSITAGSGNDRAFGGAGNDKLYGGSGNDLLGGGGGNDIARGGAGDDTLWGSSGDDLIFGGFDDDLIGGGANKDKLYGESGDDTLYGGGGKDTVGGGSDDDLVSGGAGTDLVTGGTGDDTLWGQAGADTLNGGSGDDDISGGGQGDRLNGQQGDDTLNGGFGNDTLSGGADDDVLNGNFGNDVLTGGLGSDIFVFDANGAKRVTDFDGSQEDMLHIDNALWGGATLSAAQVVNIYADDSSGTVIFNFGGGNTITLEGVSSTSGLAGDLLVI